MIEGVTGQYSNTARVALLQDPSTISVILIVSVVLIGSLAKHTNICLQRSKTTSATIARMTVLGWDDSHPPTSSHPMTSARAVWLVLVMLAQQ